MLLLSLNYPWTLKIETIMFLWNTGWLSTDYTAVYPRRQNSSQPPRWEPQILYKIQHRFKESRPIIVRGHVSQLQSIYPREANGIRMFPRGRPCPDTQNMSLLLQTKMMQSPLCQKRSMDRNKCVRQCNCSSKPAGTCTLRPPCQQEAVHTHSDTVPLYRKMKRNTRHFKYPLRSVYVSSTCSQTLYNSVTSPKKASHPPFTQTMCVCVCVCIKNKFSVFHFFKSSHFRNL
jgi:hypothetical protein